MKSDNELKTIIDQYHTGQISRSEMQDLISDHPELAAPFDDYNKEILIANELAKIELKKHTKDVYKKSRNNWWKKSLLICIVACSSLFALYAFLKDDIKKDEKTAEQLFAAFYQKPNVPTLRSGQDDLIKWESGLKAYNNNNDGLASQLFKELVETDLLENKDQVYLYLGVSLMEIKDYNLAVDYFKLISKESIFFQEGMWYEALAHLQLNEKNKAILILEKLTVNESNFKSKEASDLIRGINNN